MPLKMRCLASGASANSVMVAECNGARRSARPAGRPERPARGYHLADADRRPPLVMSDASLRVAILGAGAVGREVVRGLLEWPGRLSAAADGARFELAGI